MVFVNPRLETALTEAIAIATARAVGRPPIVAVAGAQGSGKSTLIAEYRALDASAAAFSLDDFYLPGEARRALAASVHPLLATRGPPGTHDLAALEMTLDALLHATPESRTPIRRFDKREDEPASRADWDVFEGQPSLILIDGWCLGATPQTPEALAAPVNALEAREDRDGAWRRFVNAELAGPYQRLFSRFDSTLHLQAPDFGAVLGWRLQQEEGLLGRAPGKADRARIARFIAHFERLTRHMLAGGCTADYVAALNASREISTLGPGRPRAG